MLADLGVSERNDAADVVDVHWSFLSAGLRRKLADPLDHVRRPVTVLHDGVERLPDAVEIGPGRRQPVEESRSFPTLRGSGSGLDAGISNQDINGGQRDRFPDAVP